MRQLAAGLILALTGCATMEQKPPNLMGDWGGPHAAVTLEGGLGQAQFDCASGTIDKAIIPGPDGRFTVTGMYMEGQSGPIRVGQIFKSQRATYTGEIAAQQMILRVALEDGTVLGPFTLTENAPPQLTRCL
jgi:hypothetical protein